MTTSRRRQHQAKETWLTTSKEKETQKETAFIEEFSKETVKRRRGRRLR